MPTFQETVDDLRWKKFPVLNDGFVCLVDVMGSDARICDAARLTSGAGAKDDRNLIRYLMRHHHGTPLEFITITLHIRCPMDVMRQWSRHRTWKYLSINEYSTRYSEAIDSAQTTDVDEWRAQATNNRQGSGGNVTEWPEGYRVIDDDEGTKDMIEINDPVFGKYEATGGCPDCQPGDYLSHRESTLHQIARDTYEERLAFGVAREQARKDLPLSTYTELWVEADLRNMLEFLSLRMDSHAQKEIRDYATIIGEQIVAPLYPLAWEAFCDYRLNAMTLSALEVTVLDAFNRSSHEMIEEKWAYAFDAGAEWKMAGKNRERDEFIAKLPRLGHVWDGRWIKQEA